MTCHMTSPLQEDPDVIEGDEEEVVMETTELTGEELLTRDYLSTVSPLNLSIFLPYLIAIVSTLYSFQPFPVHMQWKVWAVSGYKANLNMYI